MSLDRDGFQLVWPCFPDTDCDTFCGFVDHVQSAGTRNLLSHDWCRQLADDVRNRLGKAVPQLQTLSAIQCTYFNKSRSVNWNVGFHQDRSVPLANADGE